MQFCKKYVRYSKKHRLTTQLKSWHTVVMLLRRLLGLGVVRYWQRPALNTGFSDVILRHGRFTYLENYLRHFQIYAPVMMKWRPWKWRPKNPVLVLTPNLNIFSGPVYNQTTRRTNARVAPLLYYITISSHRRLMAFLCTVYMCILCSIGNAYKIKCICIFISVSGF